VTIVRGSPPRVIALGLAAAVIAAACGAATSSVIPTAGASAVPVASAATPEPTSSPWPGNVPSAIIALAAADSQIEAAGKAMDAAIQAKDVAALAAAANGLVALIDANADYVATAQGYVGTKELSDGYATAFTQIRSGASDIAAGTQAGDGAKVNAGVAALGAGIGAFAVARRGLGNLLEQALAQKKKYVK